ncbi:uncharacterized protein LOC130810066 [Amaranthus tricolor]|uniref:uncharacterized protein LOC130810066 n=1 Tax=Amaranthus tricolor TaxID=29722 RepID=UPI002587DD3A|nr:uncharacterized protein LOC130810066 [Amaranthus tricolor]XP_057531985.1 uncharacterized protein LOC130810066 [Amaranthus tricolor]XP_057531986.1 uncharacterized protein LOC130810066 [Amaranthus tricolor]XP_057531987.1 uncharacterized protein LOC130810066 [Amaranthus tricolor]
MSRATKWKVDKNKVKVVFRLQFHATHIPQTGWNNLFISFVPADSGKATAKTNKANVRNGSCKWADPIYETTRLLQDSKTKQFEDKIYKIPVAMGTSRSSLLGEASINLSDYVDALKPTVVALPLLGSDSGAMLHVTVQLLTSKTGFREFEQQREVSDRGLQTNTDHDSGKLLTPVDAVVSRIEKVNSRVKFKPEPRELPSLEEESGISEEYAESAAGFDLSSNTSGSLSAEKHENSSTREFDSAKSITSGDPRGVSPTQSPRTEKGASDHCFLEHGTCDWVHPWGTENSTDAKIAMVYEENSRLKAALEAADISIRELRMDVASVQRYADDAILEAQNVTKKLSVEISSDQELVNEVSLLKSECSRFRDDLEWLKSLKLNPPIARKIVEPDQHNIIKDMSLRWMKGLSVVDDKVKEVREKAHLGFDGKDLALVHADLEALSNMLQILKQETEGSMFHLEELSASKANDDGNASSKIDLVTADTGLGVELCHPEGVLLPGLLAPGTGSVDATNALQGEIFKLLRELDESKAERECFLRKMDQMECYYEALIQELEENQKQILGELQNLRNEHSSCIYTVSSTKAQMEAMHQQMSNELLQLAEERCNLDAINKELERRAVSSEAALKRARLNYSIAVNQLQKDLGVLSLQVHSMYETNENLIHRAFSEPSEPLLNGSQDAMPSNLAEGSNTEKVTGSPKDGMAVKNQFVRSDTLLEDLKRSLALQEELYGKIQEELFEMHLANVHLDIFSVMLLEALEEAALGSRLADAEMREMAKQLELTMMTNESLKVKLENMRDNVHNLSEEKAIIVSRCNELVLNNEKLEANLTKISDEKLSLEVKVGEMESLLSEYKNYKTNYEDCNAEKAKLTILLEEAAEEKIDLSNEISSLQDELISMKNRVGEMEHLRNLVDYLREKLESLSVFYSKQVDSSFSWGTAEDTESYLEKFKHIIMQFEECQQKLENKIVALVNEKVELQDQRDSARVSLADAKSEIEVLKQKFWYDVENMVNKFNKSSTLVENLQKNVEIVGDKLKVYSEAEENHTRVTQDLLSDFAQMDVSFEELTSRNKDLALEITALQSVTDDLEGNRSTIDRITQENRSLTESLCNKTIECDLLTAELNNLKENVENLQDELALQRGFKNQLEADLSDINARLKDREEELSHFDQQKAEISQSKQLLSDIEGLKCLLECCQKENDDLILSNEELENRFLVLKAFVEEMGFHRNIHEDYKQLQKQCSDLTRKLSEQALKTEEFKNLSIHLKELKDKADAAHTQAREKKETDGSSATMQESLRIAFIKEQYETKMQELRHQLSISKKHGEEMLWKLQDALDDLENKKKSEASQLKRNEELLLRISELETELHSVLSDNREKVMAFEQLKAELDCSVMSLDCCKEEKKQLMESLQKSHDENGRLVDEVELMREQIENLKAFMTSPKNNEDPCRVLQMGLNGPSNIDNLSDKSLLSRRETLDEVTLSISSDDQADDLSHIITPKTEREDGENRNPSATQDALVTSATKDLSGITKSRNDTLNDDSEHVTLLNDQMNTQNLLSCIDHLQKELERMRSENSLLEDENADGLDFEELQRDQIHLEKVSKELGDMSSLYNDSSRSGNSVERVLALELELAKALQAKKSTIQFQSSFLKLHSDEAAIFQSFRDINELIKDMLGMKERYGAMEAELQEMHKRYSQLSLDFAEVEGERQKLTMTLKNTRSSKRLMSTPIIEP